MSTNKIGTFREWLRESELNEGKVKIKKELLFELPVKQYSSQIPLCRKISKEIKNVCDLIEHKGYYTLKNKKSFKIDLVISPENLSKIPGAIDALKNNTVFKIGVSDYMIYSNDTICNKVQEVIVTGESLGNVPNSVQNSKYLNAQLIYGFNLATMTENIALRSIKDGLYGGYFNKDKNSLRIHGLQGSIDTSKPFVTWAQQHAAVPFRLWNADEVKWFDISMSVMFPKAYNKSTINKKDVFVIN